MKVVQRAGATMVALALFGLGYTTVPLVSAADRDKLLSERGVYVTFVAFGIEKEWARLDQKTRLAHLSAFKEVVERHREKLAIDTHLLRGLSDNADILLRVHSTEVQDSQQFLVDVLATQRMRTQ